MELDEGFMYGLGAFETIAVENHVPILLGRHLERLHDTLHFLEIDKQVGLKDVEKALSERTKKREVMKIMVSQHNTIFTYRDNPYQADDYQLGFSLRFSDILRNETSLLTYHKTLNYGDCILEKRRHPAYHDSIFLNRRNEICEGASTNIFFVNKGKIYTPKYSSGLLPGILRGFLLDHFDIQEKIIIRDEIMDYDECFVTNSVLGIMPVRVLDSTIYHERKTVDSLHDGYLRYFNLSLH